MNRENLRNFTRSMNLVKMMFLHQHYMIITRAGIDKIQAIEGISIVYDVINSMQTFAVVRANASKDGKEIQTFVLP